VRLRPLSVCAFLLLLPLRVSAEKLVITSTPPGATVEISGIVVGTTPFEKDFPGGYFHRTRTSLGSRLEHPLVARLNLAGYATKEIPLTEGPMEWISLNGRKHGEYFLFKADHFDVQLDSITQTFTGEVGANRATSAPTSSRPQLALEELVARAKPAVLYLKGSDRSGCSRDCPRERSSLSATDLMTVLRRFYPEAQFAAPPESVAVSADNSTETPISAQSQSTISPQSPVPEGTGTVSITSDPDGAEIFVDEKCFGDAPVTLRLPVGTHSIVLKIPGHADWHRTLEVLKANKATLKAVFDAAP